MKLECIDEPRFKIGDRAWGVGRGSLPRLEEVTIQAIRWVQINEGLVHVGYTGNRFNFDAPDMSFWGDNELFTNKSKAEKLCKRIEIDVESVDWQKMIGDRGDDSHYDSELGTCCSNISAARDILIQLREDGGKICVRDIDKMDEYLKGCVGDGYFSKKHLKDYPNLAHMYKLLGIPK